MIEQNTISRRRFIGSLTSTGLLTIVPRHVLGGTGFIPPSDTLYIAAVGAGGQAGRDIDECDKAGAKIVALCDVDQKRAEETYNKYTQTRRYKDYRLMLDMEKNVDAVIVGTPDHTHARAVIAALERNKHVFCEKPLAHSMREVRKIVDVARKHDVVTQLGNQGHSFDHIRLFCEWIWDDAIGDVREVHCLLDSSYGRMDQLGKVNEKHEIPETLDWDLWLGPARHRPYNPMYCPGSWRGWSRFGTGVVGDWVCHIVDPVFWALDLGYPAIIQAQVDGYDPKIHSDAYPDATKIIYDFPAREKGPAVKLVWYDGGLVPPRPEELEEGRDLPKKGAIVIGDRGKIMYGSHGASGCRIFPESKMKEYKTPPETLPRSIGHHKEWVEACKGNGKTGSPFEYGGPLTEIALLGMIAIRLNGEKLEWDGVKGEFANSSEANAYLEDPYRKGWEL